MRREVAIAAVVRVDIVDALVASVDAIVGEAVEVAAAAVVVVDAVAVDAAAAVVVIGKIVEIEVEGMVEGEVRVVCR